MANNNEIINIDENINKFVNIATSKRIISDAEKALSDNPNMWHGAKTGFKRQITIHKKHIANYTNKLTKESFDEDQFIEDILALDEISKATLGSYIRAASYDKAKRHERQKEIDSKDDDLSKASHAVSSVAGVVDQGTRAEADNAIHKVRKALDKERDKNSHRLIKRTSGISKAVSKLTKEDQDKVNLALDLLEQMELEMEAENTKVISESTKAVVDAIIAGESSKVQELVNTAMQEKIEAALEIKRAEVTSKMFNESAEEQELTLEDYSLEELEEFMVSEEYEALDELSKKTLGSYVKKAIDSTDKLSMHKDAIHDHLRNGLNTKKSEKINALSKLDLPDDDHNKIRTSILRKHDEDEKRVSKTWKDIHRVHMKRKDGISKAIDKLTKESAE